MSKLSDWLTQQAQDTLDEHVRPEIQALAKRGNVTPAELAELRCNSWEREHLVPAMTDEAFVTDMEHVMANCGLRKRPYVVYDEAVVGLHAPELLRRFKLATQAAEYHRKKWEESEKYITPCFRWAEEYCTNFNLQQAVHDNPGKNCVQLLVERLRFEAQAAAQDATSYAETVDGVRQALGQDATHYMVVAGDVNELVEAIKLCESDGGCRAMVVLRQLRERCKPPPQGEKT